MKRTDHAENRQRQCKMKKTNKLKVCCYQIPTAEKQKYLKVQKLPLPEYKEKRSDGFFYKAKILILKAPDRKSQDFSAKTKQYFPHWSSRNQLWQILKSWYLRKSN